MQICYSWYKREECTVRNPTAEALILTHILQTDFAKGSDKPTRIAETGRISVLSSRPPSTFPKMWVRIRLERPGLSGPFTVIRQTDERFRHGFLERENR